MHDKRLLFVAVPSWQGPARSAESDGDLAAGLVASSLTQKRQKTGRKRRNAGAVAERGRKGLPGAAGLRLDGCGVPGAAPLRRRPLVLA